MNKLLILLFLFSTGSVTGWVIELFFRRYLDPVERKKKKWVNPGFFVGPYLPIYGSGLIVLYGLGHIKLPSLGVTHPVLEKLIIFIIMAACMTLLEFITGMIFINHLHLQLWDYSPYWGNIKGVICPLFSLLWYALAAFYYLIMHPRVEAILLWLSNNLAFSFFVGLFYGIFILDVVYSFNIVMRIRKLAEEYHVIVRYRALKSKVQDLRDEAKDRSLAFIFTRFTATSLRSMFADYRENFSVKKKVVEPIKEKITEIKNRKDVIKPEDDGITIEEKK